MMSIRCLSKYQNILIFDIISYYQNIMRISTYQIRYFDILHLDIIRYYQNIMRISKCQSMMSNRCLSKYHDILVLSDIIKIS